MGGNGRAGGPSDRPASDRDAIRRAFDRLAERGWIARENWTCCNTCGYAEIQDTVFKDRPASEFDDAKIVFWHHQAEEAAFGEDGADALQGPLFLTFDGPGEEIVEGLRQIGLAVLWDGDIGHKIKVLPTYGTGTGAQG